MMEGRNGNLMATGAYWLFYVVSVSGALLHWRLGNEAMSAVCVVAAVSGALLIGRGHQNAVPQR